MRLTEVDVDMIHDGVDEVGNLKLSICLFNDSYEIPMDWHDGDEFMELKLNFHIHSIVQSIIESYEIWVVEDGEIYFLEKEKDKVDQLKKQLQDGLDRINKIKFLPPENKDEANQQT